MSGGKYRSGFSTLPSPLSGGFPSLLSLLMLDRPGRPGGRVAPAG